MTTQRSGAIAWFAGNSVAANLLMVGIIVLGLLSISGLRKEAFPPWPSETVTVSMVYDSGDPVLSEEGIAIKIEEALNEVQGVKRITSTSNASGSRVSVEAKSGYSLDTLMRDVKTKVDAIYSFPADAENPVIEKQRRSDHAYSVKIFGDADAVTFQTLAEQLKLELLASSAISQVSIKGKAELMLSIEIDENKLQAFGLSLSDIKTAVNAESGSSISTSLRNKEKTIFLKASEQEYYRRGFEQIPIVRQEDGAIIRLGQIADISDGFSDRDFILSRYNGMRGIGVEITVDEYGDVIKIVEQADKIVAAWKTNVAVPDGVYVETWNDGSQLIVDRLSLLIKNAASGIALVFIMLALFLNFRVAFWVTAGLPFIFCGTLFFMGDSFTAMTINEMTTFGFILALGIVVDDAIVVGESIYDTRKQEGDSLESTINGTLKVAGPTIFGVLTTVATFVALSNVSGGMGHVYSQFAVVVTICLLLSIVESKFILPSHLAHLNTRRQEPVHGWRNLWPRLQHACDSGLQWINQSIYHPTIRYAIHYRYAVVVMFLAIFALVIYMPMSGVVRTTFFPDIPGSSISASFTMQNDASFGLTHENLLLLEELAYEADEQLREGTGEPAISTIEVIASGDSSGSLSVELFEGSAYSINAFAQRWRELAGIPEGIKKLNIRSGFGGRDNFKVELKAWNQQTLAQSGASLRQALGEIDGVFGIDDNFNSGQEQLLFTLNENGHSLGLSTADLSRQLLQAFGGEVIQRFQRGKNEVKVRARYPENHRRSIEDVLESNIRTSSGAVLPLSSVATVAQSYQQNERTRIGGLPAFYITASVNKEQISSNELVSQLKEGVVPGLLENYPDLNIYFAGEAEQQAETTSSMIQLFIFAMIAIYVLLAIPLRSYGQPLIIMSVIPFGLVGAILGHWLNDMPLSILSFNGIVALSGVVVNDSLLLVSRINSNLEKGDSVREAIFESCTGRLRPVLLTSLTTFAGLAPLLAETSPQAQFIIPAAASLGYGILFATLITLVIIPSLIMIQHDVLSGFRRMAQKTSYETQVRL